MRVQPFSRFSPPHNGITQKRMSFTCHHGFGNAYLFIREIDRMKNSINNLNMVLNTYYQNFGGTYEQ
jgi:hypothetical protein